MKTKTIPLSQLRNAEWNANRVKPSTMEKIRTSIERYGVVENLVARPHPDEPGAFEVLSGNHRLQIFRDLGLPSAPVVLVELDDAHARLLAQTLNRTRGDDDPEAYKKLLEDALAQLPAEDVLSVLPETEESVAKILGNLGAGGGAGGGDDGFESQYGVIVVVPDQEVQQAVYDALQKKYGKAEGHEVKVVVT